MNNNNKNYQNKCKQTKHDDQSKIMTGEIFCCQTTLWSIVLNHPLSLSLCLFFDLNLFWFEFSLDLFLLSILLADWIFLSNLYFINKCSAFEGEKIEGHSSNWFRAELSWIELNWISCVVVSVVVIWLCCWFMLRFMLRLILMFMLTHIT